MENLHQEETVTEVFCHNCGHSIPNGAKFCMECGTLLSNHCTSTEDNSIKEQIYTQSEQSDLRQTFIRVQQTPNISKPKKNLHIFSWLAVLFFVMSGMAFWPNASGILFILLALYLCPIKPIRAT